MSFVRGFKKQAYLGARAATLGGAGVGGVLGAGGAYRASKDEHVKRNALISGYMGATTGGLLGNKLWKRHRIKSFLNKVEKIEKVRAEKAGRQAIRSPHLEAEVSAVRAAAEKASGTKEHDKLMRTWDELRDERERLHRWSLDPPFRQRKYRDYKMDDLLSKIDPEARAKIKSVLKRKGYSFL
jgi:hypothetical protein